MEGIGGSPVPMIPMSDGKIVGPLRFLLTHHFPTVGSLPCLSDNPRWATVLCHSALYESHCLLGESQHVLLDNLIEGLVFTGHPIPCL